MFRVSRVWCMNFELSNSFCTDLQTASAKMARSSMLPRVLLVCFVIGLSWYTIQLYAGLFKSSVTNEVPPDAKDTPADTGINKDDVKKVEDPDLLIDKEVIKEAEKQWDETENNLKVPENLRQLKCDMQKECSDSEFTFRITTGAANVIGPSVCFDGKWVMKNALNNVDRGMNIAVVHGRTGKTVDKSVFDLYGKDSTEVKAFLKKVEDDHIVLVTTYDDAAFKLDDEARNIFQALGSQKAKTLAFRDNWIFVGGKKLQHPSNFEHVMINDKSKNKFGDWPEAISLEGCIPRL